MTPEALSASDALSTAVDLLDKLGILEKVYLKLVNNPREVAKQLNEVITILDSAFGKIQNSVAQMCTLSFEPAALASTRKILIEKNNGLSQELGKVSIHCADIGRIYNTYLRGALSAFLNEEESIKLNELFFELNNSDGHFKNAVAQLDQNLKDFSNQAFAHIEQNEPQKAETLTWQLRSLLEPTRKVLEAKIRELRSLQLKFLEMDVVNPCEDPPVWPSAPSPSVTPLKVMEWSSGTTKDQFGCSRDSGKKFHAGIDIKAPVGTPCYAMENAKVEEVGFGEDVGKYVSISFKKAGKDYGVAYCHLKNTSVKKGASVKAGDQVGDTGITGNADASNPHLHLEIQDQVWIAYANAADRSVHGINPNNYIVSAKSA